MKLCDWCEAPISEASELCAACLKAQADVAAGELLPATHPRKQQETILRTIGNVLVITLKGFAILVGSILMIITALLGTCSTVVMIAVVTAFPWPLFYLALAAFWFGITYTLYRLTGKMVKNIKPIETKSYPPISYSPISSIPAIPESHPDEGDQTNE